MDCCKTAVLIIIVPKHRVTPPSSDYHHPVIKLLHCRTIVTSRGAVAAIARQQIHKQLAAIFPETERFKESQLSHFHALTARWQQLAEWELDWCRRFNRATDRQGLERLFASVSRLGDGVFWYALMIALPLVQGYSALPTVGQMAMVGLLCLAVYKWLKARTRRPRPCARHALIRATVPPLDQYSFPSGHTLHAVAFSTVAVFHYPRLIWLLLPFTTLVALSRLVLGLHYPSDVLAGALLGAGLSILVLQF